MPYSVEFFKTVEKFTVPRRIYEVEQLFALQRRGANIPNLPVEIARNVANHPNDEGVYPFPLPMPK